jgi:hypothetical protein
MELALKWRGIGVTVQVKRIEELASRAPKQGLQPPSPEQRRAVEKQYLLTSGNRYAGPTR